MWTLSSSIRTGPPHVLLVPMCTSLPKAGGLTCLHWHCCYQLLPTCTTQETVIQHTQPATITASACLHCLVLWGLACCCCCHHQHHTHCLGTRGPTLQELPLPAPRTTPGGARLCPAELVTADAHICYLGTWALASSARHHHYHHCCPRTGPSGH